MLPEHPGIYPVAWDREPFADIYARRLSLPVAEWVAFVAYVRRMRSASTCPSIRWPHEILDVQVHDLILGQRSLTDATRMLHEGRISQDTFDAYYDVWELLRVDAPSWEAWSKRVSAEAVGPAGAACVARFLSYAARGVLFLR